MNNDNKQIPFDEKIERTVIGCFLIDSNASIEYSSQLLPDMFFTEQCKSSLIAIRNLINEGIEVDMLSVFKESSKLKNGVDANFLNNCMSSINNTSNLAFYVASLKEFHVRRVLYSFSLKVSQNALNLKSDPLQLIGEVQRNLNEAVDSLVVKPVDELKVLVKERLHELTTAKKEDLKIKGVPTGLISIDEMFNGRMQNGALIILAGRPSQGKCLGINTLCLMFDGTLRKVQDVKVGDLLMGDDYTPRKVLSLARGREMMYWVRQNKGIDYRVNESHIISLNRSRKVKDSRLQIVNLSVKDYINKSDKFKSNYKGYKRDWELSEKEILLDPYYLGIWLGDGSSDNQRISNPDKEIHEWLRIYAKELGLEFNLKEYKGKCPYITLINKSNNNDFNIQKILRFYNLLDNKHIPDNYLYNSKSNRLKLLAGLLDTDGYLDKNNNSGFEIIQKNEVLAKQIVYLANSLGFRVNITSKIGKIKSINFEGVYYRITINGNTEIIPTKVNRKVASKRKCIKDWRNNSIIIEKDKIDDYYGFEIDGNKLFLLEDGTVTHNTTLALNILRNASLFENSSVAIFSLEMSKQQLTNKFISTESDINSKDIDKGFVYDNDKQALIEASGRLYDSKIFIDDSSYLTPMILRSKATNLKVKHNIKLIVVDYLQLMSGDDKKGKNREQEISEISRSLKILAKDLDLPIIALSQLSRACETRTDKRPMLSDLRESGSIEQDADNVLFVFRPEYYKFENFEDGSSTHNKAEIIFGKNRGGEVGTKVIDCDLSKSKFFDLSQKTVYNSAKEVNYKLPQNIISEEFDMPF